jgi:hypothetical protein
MPFLWFDDAVLGSMGRAAIWDVVVVHPTGLAITTIVGLYTA